MDKTYTYLHGQSVVKESMYVKGAESLTRPPTTCSHQMLANNDHSVSPQGEWLANQLGYQDLTKSGML